MTVSPMALIYPNDYLEDHEGDTYVTRLDYSLELTHHASIRTGNTPAQMPPRDHSDSFDDKETSINPKADTEGKEPVAVGNQYSVCGSPKCYNGSVQLVQMKQPPHHREELGTGVVYLSTLQSKEFLIDTSPQFLPLHIALNLCESIMSILSGQNDARRPKDGTEDIIED